VRIADDKLKRHREGEDSFCAVCVYARVNLLDAGLELPGKGPCGMGCAEGERLCISMRTSDCSIKVFPPAGEKKPDRP